MSRILKTVGETHLFEGPEGRNAICVRCGYTFDDHLRIPLAGADTRCSPIDYINEELLARGWTRETLCKESMLGPTIIDAVLSGKRKVNLVVAHGLSLAFGTNRDYWVNLQSLYDAPMQEP